MDEKKVAVAPDDIAKFKKESVSDYNKNIDGVYSVYKCQKLTGIWINCMRKASNEYENNDYAIISQNSRINVRKKTKRAVYLTGMDYK
jgi:hypothetical protein